MSLKEKIERIVHHGEEIADAEYRKLVGEVLALFHEHVTGEAITPKPTVPQEAEPVVESQPPTEHDLAAAGESATETGDAGSAPEATVDATNASEGQAEGGSPEQPADGGA